MDFETTERPSNQLLASSKVSNSMWRPLLEVQFQGGRDLNCLSIHLIWLEPPPLNRVHCRPRQRFGPIDRLQALYRTIASNHCIEQNTPVQLRRSARICSHWVDAMHQQSHHYVARHRCAGLAWCLTYW